MNKDKHVFTPLISFLYRSKFTHIVAKYQGDRYVKHFTCRNHLLALMFGNYATEKDCKISLVP